LTLNLFWIKVLLTQDYRNLKKACKILCLILISNYSLTAQDSTNNKLYQGFVELGTIISTSGETPFWLKANQYGIISSTAPAALFRAGISSGYKKYTSKESKIKANKFDWGYGLEIAGNLSPKNNLDPDNRGPENKILIPEIYVKAKFGVFEIYAGRRREIVGLVDTALTSGSYIWSGNALPMPKIQISNPDYVPLGFTKGFISFKGSYAHGWFENNRTDVKNFYLHQKTLYLKIGKPNGKFHIYGGFNHQVQWGGELKYIDPDNLYAYNGKIGSNFSDYVGVVTGRSLAASTDTIKVGKNDATNRGGNHLGSLDIGFEFKTKKVDFVCYRQNLYEDGSLFFLNNITDGLNGISLKFKNNFRKTFFSINKITLEFLNTVSQGGQEGADNTIGRLRGQDNYFNNGVYRNGWSYNQNSIGTSFINNVSTKKPISLFYNNSRVQALYMGISGQVKDNITTEIRLSYSKNFGSYSVPFDKTEDQYSGIIKVFKPLRKYNNTVAFVNLAFDRGNLFSTSLGGYLGIRKGW
jgi:hypothetical protein